MEREEGSFSREARGKEPVLPVVKTTGYSNLKPPLIKDPNLVIYIILGLAGIMIVSIAVLSITKSLAVMFAILISIVAYGAACPKKITAEEKAIKITLWTPNTDWVYSGGLYWRWFLLEWFYSFPTEQIVIDIPEQEIITQEKIVEGKTISGAVVKINSVFYGFWPDNAESLCLAYKKAPDPYDHEKLTKFFVPFLASVERRVAGRFDWLELQQTRKDFTSALDEEVKKDKEGPMAKSRITEFSIQFEVVKLPTGLAEAITTPQIAAFQLEAGKKTAQLERIKKEEAGKGDAFAREQLLQAMQKYPKQAIVLMYEEMARGQASTIFYELPRELKEMIKESNEIPEDLGAIWQTIPKAERALMARKLLESLKKK